MDPNSCTNAILDTRWRGIARECVRWMDSGLGNVPSCEQIVCPGPIKPEYGYFDGKDFTFDKSITFGCDSGYSLVGNRERRCTKDRKWSGEQPVCVPVECPPPKRILNGHTIGTNFEFQNTVEYTCEAGYKLEGLKIRRCLENASWNGDPPVCERVTCPTPKLLNTEP